MTYLWHYDLHKTVASERLYFLAFKFRENYDRDVAVDAIEVTFRKLDVTSYVVWEMFGGIDLLVKVWLPARLEIADVQTALVESVSPPHEFIVTKFSVEKTIYHWLWPREVPARSRVSIAPRDMVELNSNRPPPPRVVKSYLDANVIARSQPSKTVKFFMRITESRDRPNDWHADKSVADRLIRVVTSVQGIRSPSIFQGEGFARYLISGRTLPSQWEVIGSELTTAINALGLNLYRGMRTVTHFSSLANPVARREQLLSSAQDGPGRAETLDDLLAQDEHRGLEFKASAFVDVRRAVRGRAQKLEEAKEMQDVILKSVTGLLNGSGGKLVLGVAEASDFTLDELRRVYPKATPVGDYVVIGVAPEFRRKQFDDYQRRLRQLVGKHIEPDPRGWIEYTKIDHEAGPVVIVTVRRPDRWFYAGSVASSGTRPRFYARLGNETESLDGASMDAYKEKNPRTTG